MLSVGLGSRDAVDEVVLSVVCAAARFRSPMRTNVVRQNFIFANFAQRVQSVFLRPKQPPQLRISYERILSTYNHRQSLSAQSFLQTLPPNKQRAPSPGQDLLSRQHNNESASGLRSAYVNYALLEFLGSSAPSTRFGNVRSSVLAGQRLGLWRSKTCFANLNSIMY
jgi:hypothetical protein